MYDQYLESAKKQFTQYKLLGEKAMSQIPEEKLFWAYNSESNSVSTIVKHLWGNMLSRFTGFLDSDGEKPWRQREAEFDNDINTRDDLMNRWNAGWACLFDALNPLTATDLDRIIYIRNEKHTVLEAINRQLTHYAYHVGQIVFLGKMICGENWQSLSIPRGGTDRFNEEKFSASRQ
ncbi:MAG TPA: DUF1572 family protein [Puia sp.]|nr:DUF1572 family protein [Puia sp.]